MKVLGVIPARFGSTRFPGKPLASLGNKPVIQWVYENAKRASGLDEVIIATDDERILRQAQKFKAEVLMTSSRHNSGTERVAEVAGRIKAEIIVNIQGDEPFLKASTINRLVKEFAKDRKAEMATLATRIRDPEDLDDPDVVKVVFDKNNYALYFSRSNIPYHRTLTACRKPLTEHFKHLGMYAYRKRVLPEFVKLPQSDLEKTECLEQLRALENGIKIRIIKVREDTIGIDTPQDLVKARRQLSCRWPQIKSRITTN
jgi:3-deoxy-manno-octulosonate cytidylyltransferase (CMP-KDO synthetase)